MTRPPKPSLRASAQGSAPRARTHRQVPHVPPEEQSLSDEQRLWVATIYNAVLEAMGTIKEGSDAARKVTQSDAIAWFENNSRDFRDVCTMAGLEPDQIRASALELIKNGKPIPRMRNDRDGRRRRVNGHGMASKGSGKRRQEIAAHSDRGCTAGKWTGLQ
jgi:hypothetical protein